jgi:hypothetical protein
MATGQLQGGGVFAWPDVPETGYESWASMTSMQPGHPLVGGSAGSPGYGAGTRQVAVAAPMTAAASGSPTAASWKELGNLTGNPVGWVLIALLLYMVLTHLHLRAGAGVRYGKG